METPEPAAKKSTYQQLTKISGVNFLYRHEDGTYWGRKKFPGEKSPKLKKLDTDNRKAAEVELKKWIDKNTTATGKGAEITMENLCAIFLENKKGNKPKTLKNYDWVIKRLREEFPHFKTPIFKINGLEYSKFVSGLKLNPAANNSYLDIMSAILDTAVAGEYLKENPLVAVQEKGIKIRKKRNRKRPTIPTDAQANAIIEGMINKGKANGKKSSKDFLKFLYLAGIGEAELRAIHWSDVDWTAERINLSRIKTGKDFYIPFFDWLKPFMVDLHNRRGNPKAGAIFTMLTIKQGIYNTCDRLKLPQFSPRNFRQANIVRLLRAGVPVSLVAKYNCHSDNGRLIQTTYSDVISESDSDYEKEMLKRTVGK